MQVEQNQSEIKALVLGSFGCGLVSVLMNPGTERELRREVRKEQIPPNCTLPNTVVSIKLVEGKIQSIMPREATGS